MDSALWEFKETLEDLKTLEQGDPYTFASQYQQWPSPIGGGLFKDENWKYYEVLPSDITTVRIYCDTAQEVNSWNDYTVFQCWAKSAKSGIYLVDQLRGKWESPEIERNLVDFWNKHKPNVYKPKGADMLKIEKASSGSGLIQAIKKQYTIPVQPIVRHKDKLTRAMAVIKYFCSGYIHLPLNETWVSDYKSEFRAFTPMMTHKHDDQLDPTFDAVEDLLVFPQALYTNDSI